MRKFSLNFRILHCFFPIWGNYSLFLAVEVLDLPNPSRSTQGHGVNTSKVVLTPAIVPSPTRYSGGDAVMQDSPTWNLVGLSWKQNCPTEYQVGLSLLQERTSCTHGVHSCIKECPSCIQDIHSTFQNRISSLQSV